MSKIEVDQVDPQSGTTLTLGTSGDTVRIPTGVTLANSGTATGFAGIAWQSVVTAATLTAVAGRGYPIDTSSNACTVTLPAAASVGDQIIFTDYARNWNTNALTINPNSLNYQGNTTPQPVYNTTGESIHIVYMDVTKGWIPINDGAVALETPQAYSADMLVVAGGGSGGGWTGGGGGAGGYRTSTQTFTPSTVYTVTVGDGGAARVDSNTPSYGNNGSTSSISGSGLTTITSAGGGGGGGYEPGTPGDGEGRDGGSGGGGGGPTNEPGGSGDTPATVPSQGNDGSTSNGTQFNLGGGGGASAPGGPNTTTAASDGGAGSASSITGASVTYAGGGGGHGSNTSAGSGGAGGGGAGSLGVGSGTNGTANTGGGGGGMRDTGSSGTGGKGVVILSVPDGIYSGTTTGSPTVTTNAGGTGKTVMEFTASGSYTA